MSAGPDVEVVLAAVKASALLEPGRPVLAMLSGGRDSVCLLDALAGLRSRGGAGAPGELRALHFDHGLRAPEERAGDEAFCRELCAWLGVALVVSHAPAGPPATGNVHAWAREQRYAAARREAARGGALIATGHTSSDQVETVLYRLAASPGRRALLGMPARRGSIVRPLLCVSREQTTAYCTERGLAWREDRANDDPAYARARVRNRLLPALRAVHPAAEASILATADRLREEAELLQSLAIAELEADATIELARLASLTPALARLVLDAMAARAMPEGAVPPSAGARLPEVLALGGGGIRSSDLGGGLRAVCEYGRLSMTVAPPRMQVPPPTVALPFPGAARFGAWELRCSQAPARGEPGERALVSRDHAAAGLLLRAWRHGDRMRPAGLGASKLLSDVFSDRRVPRAERRSIPLVTAGKEILWVPGVVRSEHVLADRGEPHGDDAGLVSLSARRDAL